MKLPVQRKPLAFNFKQWRINHKDPTKLTPLKITTNKVGETSINHLFNDMIQSIEHHEVNTTETMPFTNSPRNSAT